MRGRVSGNGLGIPAGTRLCSLRIPRSSARRAQSAISQCQRSALTLRPTRAHVVEPHVAPGRIARPSVTTSPRGRCSTPVRAVMGKCMSHRGGDTCAASFEVDAVRLVRFRGITLGLSAARRWGASSPARPPPGSATWYMEFGGGFLARIAGWNRASSDVDV